MACACSARFLRNWVIAVCRNVSGSPGCTGALVGVDMMLSFRPLQHSPPGPRPAAGEGHVVPGRSATRQVGRSASRAVRWSEDPQAAGVLVIVDLAACVA